MALDGNGWGGGAELSDEAERAGDGAASRGVDAGFSADGFASAAQARASIAAERARRRGLWASLLEAAERIEISIAAELRWLGSGRGLDEAEAREAASRCADGAERLADRIDDLRGQWPSDAEEALSLCRARLLATRQRAKAVAAAAAGGAGKPPRGRWPGSFGLPLALELPDEDE